MKRSQFMVQIYDYVMCRIRKMKKLLLSCEYRKYRERKEIMQKIRRILNVMEQYENNGGRLSEIDTQVLLVEPILCLAGHDIYDPFIVKRASRGANTQEFDIEVYRNNNLLFLAIEVKSLSSNEFNIAQINNNGGIGSLSPSQENGEFTNTYQDGVGQLRAYCVNWSNKLNSCTVPILTNGEEWVLFNLSQFINPDTVSQSINKSMILSQAKITDDDFYDIIVKRLKNT